MLGTKKLKVKAINKELRKIFIACAKVKQMQISEYNEKSVVRMWTVNI
jgi:hypothetical protein